MHLPSGEQLSTRVDAERAPRAVIPLASPLRTQDTCTAVVVAEAGSVSASSNSLALDTEQPHINALTYISGEVTASWNPVSSSAVSGYVMSVASLTSGRMFSKSIAGRTTASGKLLVEGVLGTNEGYVFTLSTQKADGVSAGSTPAPIITRLPRLTRVSYDDGDTLNATWTAEADTHANLSRFELTVRPPTQDTPAKTASIGNPLARQGSLSAGSLSGSYVAEIRAVASSRSVTVSAPVEIVTTKPALNNVAYTGGLLTASWAGTAGTSYHLVLFNSASSPIVSRPVSGSRGLLDIELDPNDAYTARLQEDVGISAGPFSDAVHVIAGIPVIKSVVYSGTQVVVAWSPPTGNTGITGYTAQLLADGIPLSVPPSYNGNTATFATTLETYKSYAAVVQATGANTTGPRCEPVAAIANIPVITSAVFDGSSLNVTWESLRDGVVTAYHVELYQGGTKKQDFYTAHTSLAQTLTLTAGSRYTVRIQGLAGPSAGNMSADFPVDSFGYQYFVHGAQATVQPYVYRTLKSTPASSPAETISLYLPEVFNTAQTAPITHGAFKLEPTNTQPYAYRMNFESSNAVWHFDNNSIRSGLQSDYNAFLVALEQVRGGMTAFGLALVRESLALGLPLTFDETLFYRYGFDPVNGYCDLQPGMGLRIDAEAYQFVGTSPSATQVSGFTVVGSRAYDIGAYMAPNGSRETGFNAFLSSLQRPNVPPNTRGSGGVIDLYATGFRRPYYRLFYPSSFFRR